jgi:hypothetical protein
MINWEKGGQYVGMMNYLPTRNEKLIFQHKSLHDLSRHKLDIQTFNVLTAIDGTRSVGDLIQDGIYDQSFLAEKIQLLLKLDLIEPAAKIEKSRYSSFFDHPTIKSAQAAKRFEVKQITNKPHNSFVKLKKSRKVRVFWFVAGCGLAALLLISVPTAMKGPKSGTTGSLPSPPLLLDAVDEPAAKIENIASERTKADRAQADGQGGDAVQSAALSGAVSLAPFQAPGARPVEDQPGEIEVDFNETGALQQPAPGLDVVDEPAAKIGNIESERSKVDRVQADDQNRGAVQSAALSGAVSPAPLQAPGARPAEDQPKVIEVDFNETGALPQPAPGLSALDEPAAKIGNNESERSKADRTQADGQGRGAVQSTVHSGTESPAPFKAITAWPAENQPKEIEVDFNKDFKNAPAHPEQINTGRLSVKMPYKPMKKKPPISKLPNLTVAEIRSKTRPASDAEFLHYLDQTGPGSNWKEILQYASQLWRLEAPLVDKYAHFSEYLENYNKNNGLNRLAIHSDICTLHQLKVFNMPAILEFRHPRQEVTRYLVIKSIDYQQAALSNGKSEGDIIITHYQLDRFWSGISHIPWKKVIRSADVINTKSQPLAVIELKAYLNSVGFHDLGDPEMFNKRTASAIKQIQTRFGIAPTGVVDVETHAAFNRYRERIHKRAGP